MGIWKKNLLGGVDLVVWSLRGSLYNAGLFKNEKTASDFFTKVNNELDIAFEKGKLNKSEKIFISDFTDGRSLEEIGELTPYVISGLKVCMFYNGILIESSPILDSSQIASNSPKKLDFI